ncbi:dihydrofolate reductase family protein [Acidipropionibacterium jensenii]|uniref:dihydrofolate reductase family protein n=1 Tax=Acidipropionibacterium jensenii TaxID=1749 RepID=UPI002649601A|nr:dihydrofolate reductase family protein [Acidipropionibacterium jensenii]MDN5976580.1 dihydrofolate reductase family protein [Acidipropionibacterium jensenii]MDN5995370.1 dihydrofolate reductase family protein [Acidipropionibacterium jensenii]MDN6021344.1 dihydrofolate reductase family protein [Acidipropionibacterium jensenii]MDN6425875.1 dihydrofolate reductase family protein [Acidipropionibacterium jensenii]MDN6440615.1 dihydrofolate reductase family protein [Acidipropionibacterium jenseni
MRELVYYVAVSIDGYIAAPDGSYDAFPLEGDHVATMVSEFSDAIPAHVLSALGLSAAGDRFDTVIQGRASYDIALREGITRPYSHLAEYVATRSGKPAPEGVTFTADPLATVRQLKEQPGLGIYLCGGGTLAGSLLPEIDRLILKRNPIVLGDGIRLFGPADPTMIRFDLVGCRTFGSGAAIEEYVRSAD